MNNSIMCLTRDSSEYSHDQQVKDFIQGGGQFIQLRSKSLPNEVLYHQANKAVTYAKAYGANLIINDHIELTRQIDAHGVHLGANDGSVASARKILSSEKIIGKTVHSIEEALSAKKDNPDYVGMGPYRISSTKKDLQPVLTNYQFQQIVKILDPIPVYLIGGLSKNDFSLIETLGVQGLALCSALFSGKNLRDQTKLAVDKSRAYSRLTIY
jgi:thiamine-phosphate pyrophosphorylase